MSHETNVQRADVEVETECLVSDVPIKGGLWQAGLISTTVLGDLLLAILLCKVQRTILPLMCAVRRMWHRDVLW